MAASLPWRRTYAVFYGGQFVALNGLALAMYSLGVYVYYLSHSSMMFGIALALPILPFIVASPFAGPLVDRWGPRRALVVANALGILNLAVLTLLQVTDTFSAGRIMLFLYVAAGLKALHLAAFAAAVPFVVPKGGLGRANGTRMFLTASGAVVGPVVATPLLTALGFYGVILMGCVSFLVGIGSLGAVPMRGLPPREARETRGMNLLAEFWEVWRYVTARRGLVALMLLFGVINFGIGTAELLTTQLTLSFASQGALNTVLLSGAAGVAAGTLLMTVWGRPRRRTTGVFGYSLLFAAAMVAGSLRPSVPLLAVAAFLFLGSTPIIIGTIQTLWQVKVEPRLLGRMAALADLFTDVPYSIGNVLSGFAAGLVFVPLAGRGRVSSGVMAALVGNGAGRGFALALMAIGVLIALCVLAAWRYPRLRRLEEQLPDVTPEDVAAGIGHAVAGAAAG